MNTFYIILGAGVITFFVRWLPFVIASRISYPDWVDHRLQSMSRAILGGLLALMIHGLAPSARWNAAAIVALLVVLQRVVKNLGVTIIIGVVLYAIVTIFGHGS